MNISILCDRILSQAQNSTRHLVGIAGPPGSGKSTLADELAGAISASGESVAIVPMDGFHLDNRILTKSNLLPRKGAPETVDAAGFVQLVHRLTSAQEPVYVPVFDRDKDIAIAGAASVDGRCKIVLVEGNYLLLDRPVWADLATHWNTVVFLNPGLDIIEQRLQQRWLDQGFSQADARKRVNANDMPNAKTVLSESKVSLADLIIENEWERSA